MTLGKITRQLHGFERYDLRNGYFIWVGVVPQSLAFTEFQFEELWQLHPVERSKIRIFGRKVPVPRWQQAYGIDYHFSGEVNRAVPVPALLLPLLAWSRDAIDNRLNGLLVNWYDGSLGDYIGRHRDSIKNMAVGAPIVTISFGEERIFRVRQWGAGITGSPVDIRVTCGSVIVMPYETNRGFTHEVPASKKWTGRRISVTLRGFD